MNDFEDELRRHLNERVDEKLGPRRPAPPLRAPARLGRASLRSGGPWLLPLAAAAVVLVIAAGALAATGVLADKKVVPPATQSPAPTAPLPRSPTNAPVTTSPTQSKTALTSGHMLSLGAANVWLPSGWVARDYASYEPPASGTLAAQQWCLTPSSLSPSTAPDACPLTLGTIPPTGNPVDVDITGGWESNSPTCYHFDSEETSDRQFGGRAADWRRWRVSCGGHDLLIEQYVVATGPGYILFSDWTDPTVHTAMTGIAARSSLPVQTSPLRLMDRGYLRSADRTPTGVHISIDRAVNGINGVVNNNPATYDYVMSTAMFDAASVQVGNLVALHTDGVAVRDFGLS